MEIPGLCALQERVLTVLTLVSLALFLLAVYGVANAVVVLKTRLAFEFLFGKVPVLRDLIKCPPCVAFWTGMACSRWLLSPSSTFCPVWWKAMLVDGFAALGAVWLLYLKAERLAEDPTKALDL